jgi:hypothetical protein
MIAAAAEPAGVDYLELGRRDGSPTWLSEPRALGDRSSAGGQRDLRRVDGDPGLLHGPVVHPGRTGTDDNRRAQERIGP